jgi:hypothetical protein
MTQAPRCASRFSPRKLKFAQRSPLYLIIRQLTALMLVYSIVSVMILPPASACAMAHTMLTWDHDASQRNLRVQRVKTIKEVGNYCL